jgi:DNA-directed RNA polymerase specialized sigma24 family protein
LRGAVEESSCLCLNNLPNLSPNHSRAGSMSVTLDDVLNGLTKLDEQQCRVVELRFFGGLATEEIAEILGISPSAAKRDWNIAKAWLT